MSTHEKKREVIEVDSHRYELFPNNHLLLNKFYDQSFGYGALNERAKNAYQRSNIDTPLTSDHMHVLKEHLAPEICQSIISEFEQDPQGVQHDSVAQVLVEQVFNDSIDEQIRSYFNSEYCVFWWSIYKLDADVDDAFYAAKWHCDGGPTNHLKVITYLNGYDEHESDTPFLDKETTDELKEIGYIFTELDKRSNNIEPLCRHYNVNYQPKSLKPNVGDTIVFNANQVAHRALPPVKGKTRYVLNFCVLPSELHWREVMQNYFFPIYGCQDFRIFTEISHKITANPIADEDCFEIATNHRIANLQHIEYLLANIFSNMSVASRLLNHITSNESNLDECNDLFAFLRFIKKTLIGQLQSDKMIQPEWIEALGDIAQYEQNFADATSRYRVDNKPNSEAVFWPNPVHGQHPRSKFELLPYVRKEPIMDINTPIGSAGSCFAFEIARYFQQEGYNYVVTERNDVPNSGVLVDGYNPGDEYVKFCANYGILFNSPSFMQLAERAFGTRHYNKLLFQSDAGYFIDPYREGVVFNSKAAYLADYDNHIEAVRQALLTCKVFVVTLGLNECWQLHDGTFLSRNPRENMHHLVKHRTLTVQENVEYIQRFFDIIKRHNPDFKLVISVSPIPFLATGRADEQHIISANCHSKSVLRVAADELVANNSDMYYLPSYELVTECTQEPWAPDTRHVKPETVERVVGMFKEIFVSG